VAFASEERPFIYMPGSEFPEDLILDNGRKFVRQDVPGDAHRTLTSICETGKMALALRSSVSLVHLGPVSLNSS
jgi:hypothetical protein